MTALLRDLTPALVAELGLVHTRPGNLVMIAWPGETPLCLSTFADLASVMGYNWIRADVRVSELSEDTKGKSSGALTFGNADNVWSALALGKKFTDVPIKIWDVYAGATADGDVAPRFSGVGDSVRISPDGTVRVALTQHGSGTMFCPRGVLSPPLFNHLPAPGIINYGGQQYKLMPGGQ